MPSAIKTAREYGDDLTVLFVECQGSNETAAEKFAYGKKWMGTPAMWTSERPFDTGAKGIPNFALLSADGELLMKGNPMAMHSKIMDAIDQEIANAKGLPKDAPKSLKKAYKAFAKGDYAKSIEAAQKVVDGGDEDAASAEQTLKSFQSRLDGKFKRVDWMLQNAYLVEAEDFYESLAKGVKGLEAYEERVTSLEETFDADGMKDEIKAAKSFAKLQLKLQADGLDAKHVKTLEKFVEKNAETKIVKRAQALLDLAKG